MAAARAKGDASTLDEDWPFCVLESETKRETTETERDEEKER